MIALAMIMLHVFMHRTTKHNKAALSPAKVPHEAWHAVRCMAQRQARPLKRSAVIIAKNPPAQ